MSRLPTPVRSEPGAVPTDNGVRLHDRQRFANFRERPIETNEYQSVESAEGVFLWSSSSQKHFSAAAASKFLPEAVDDRPTNEPAKIPRFSVRIRIDDDEARHGTRFAR
jgi:hypothetical protein